MVLGLDAELSVFKKLTVSPFIKYHQLNFNSEADWNLISEFQHPVSFTHKAKGYCIEPGIKFWWAFSKSWSVFFAGHVSYWNTGLGIDTLYKQNGDVVYTQVNGVNRNTSGLNVGVTKSFSY